MKPEDKNQDKVLSDDDLDTVSGGLYGSVNADPSANSALAASISVCSVQNASNGIDALTKNNR